MASPAEEFLDPFLASHEMSGTHTPDDTRDSGGVANSAENSLPPSRSGGLKTDKKRVGFSSGADSAERSPRVSLIASKVNNLSPIINTPTLSPDSSGYNSPGHARQASLSHPEPAPDKSHLPQLSPQQTKQIHDAFSQTLSVPRPRPAIRRTPSDRSALPEDLLEDDELSPDDPAAAHRRRRAQEAYVRGKRLEFDERLASEPNSRAPSPDRAKSRRRSRPDSSSFSDIPLAPMDRRSSAVMTPEQESEDEDEWHQQARTRYAEDLVRKHTTRNDDLFVARGGDSGLRSGMVTPTEEQRFMEDYQPRPQKYRGGVLGALLKLYNQPQGNESSRHLTSRSGDTSAMSTPHASPPDSGTATPTGARSPRRHWFEPKHKGESPSSLAQLIGSSATLGSPVVSGLGEQVTQRLREQKEEKEREKRAKKRSSANPLSKIRPRLEDRIRITVHIAETIARQKYLIKLCKALMLYGAPTHRLEEYLRMSARVLEIEAQFLYIPGAMIMSFDDTSTHTTEVKLVKALQGLDLGKLRDVHEVYKEVVHDRIGVEEATQRLNECMGRRLRFNKWFLILVYGFASACVGPFAFEASLIDLPMCFVLGCILGVLQLIIAPASDLYANVFEVAAAVITSFLARALGSIPYKGGRLFCFSAMAQASIALILPGYTVLCASLELQSRSIVAGSVRMVYAIIYSFFLGFGITIGTAIYGLMDKHATSETTCPSSMPGHWAFFFVPAFALCLCIINQAKIKQMPIMVFIAFAGYLVTFFSSKRFKGNTQISNALGALCIGVMANLYSRAGRRVENLALDIWEDHLRPRYKALRRRVFGHTRRTSSKKLEEGGAGGDQESLYVRQTRRIGYGLAAAAMLPAIFVQVPSGLAVSGSLVSGIASADQITGSSTNGTTVVSSGDTAGSSGLNSTALTVGYSVIQVAIGITVGLFLSAIVVYPFGKKRSGLFSF